MSIGDTVLLEAIVAPDGVTLLGDPQETVIATLTPPRLRTEAELEMELETEVVGEGGADASAPSGDAQDSGEHAESAE